MYGKRLHVLHSENPRTSNADGVAFAINKDLIPLKNIMSEVIIPGRAMSVTFPWKDDELLTLLNVYAPNNPRDNEAFWRKIRSKWKQEKKTAPDAILGDFNLVVSEQDRAPMHGDDQMATKALLALLNDWKMIDGWRTRSPDVLDFTFPAQPGIRAKSRLDRIYVKSEWLATSEGWNITQTHVPTDHKLVEAQLTHSVAPFIGKGRWSLNTHILSDDKIMNKVIERGQKLQSDLTETHSERSEMTNPQSLYMAFKNDVIKILREASKRELPKILRRIQGLKDDAEKIINAPISDDATQVADMNLTYNLIQERIISLENARYHRARDGIAARIALEGETNSKFWTRLNKEKKPRDIMYALEKPRSVPGEDPYEHRSDKMAEIAKQYHDGIQDIYEEATQEETEAATTTVLDTLEMKTNKKLRASMKADFSPGDVQEALKSSSNGKAAGLDGLPYEFWKNLDERTSAERGTEDERLNPFKILATLFNDIHDFGLDKNSTFTEGWLCPIYKQKGDRRKIENHRPITLLNTDYKLLTKIVATRMAVIAQRVIHKNQAGFIPGRSIMDQIRLTQIMIDYAEATEEEGIIVALDQEKAYDKIDHQYLWRVLAKFNIPDKSIRLVQSLYENAQTVVAINGELSKPFRVRRGVRQGDPMSCILFDLAIEPLACLLRKSKLEGYNIPGVAEKLIVTLFADDTTVYLSANDQYEDLKKLLNIWCRAAKAKFNEGKTQFIPIGPKPYRDMVVATRTSTQGGTPLPTGPLVVPEGQHVRILGAFLGNGTNLDEIWKPAVKKTINAVERWKTSHPSLKGKTIITQMMVGGITQYMTAAHGMPRHIEKLLTETIRSFIWDNRRPKVAMNVLCAQKEAGGIGLLDLQSRNKAIEIMLLKAYLDFSPSRPMWAFVADTLMQHFATKSTGRLDANAAVNPMLQYWSVNPNAKGLPKLLARIVRAAKKEKLAINVAKPGRSLRRKMPAWFHTGATKEARKLQNKPAAKCLRNNHNARTVADLLRISVHVRKPQKEPGHKQEKKCRCQRCAQSRLEFGCKNPASCAKLADDILKALFPKWRLTQYFTTDLLSLTPRRKAKNAASFDGDGNGLVTFDPTLSCRDLNLMLRIHSASTFEMPALRIPTPYNLVQEAREASVAIWTKMDRERHPSFSMAIAYTTNEAGNCAFRLPESISTETQAYLAAIAQCATDTPPFAPLTIALRSERVVKLLCIDILHIEQHGWTEWEDPSLLQATVSILRKRSASTSFRLPTNGELDDDALTLLNAARAALPGDNIWAPPPGHPEFILKGAQLSIMSQALAYHLTKTLRRPPSLAKSTRLRILQIQANCEEHTHEKDIWNAVRNKAISKPASTFIWKMIHNALSTGAYWDNIPGREQLRECPHCRIEESIEHILCECDIPGRKRAWDLVRNCLARKNIRLDAPTITTLMTPGLATPPPDGQTGPGSARLMCILLSETSFLLWKLCCERRMRLEDDQTKWHSLPEIDSRWKAAINTRLHRDKLMADPRFGRKALNRQLVLSTWSGTLEHEHLLPDDWISHPRVLVGISPPDRRAGRGDRADPAG